MMTSRYRATHEKYCSVSCALEANKEIRARTQFKSKHEPWHKGKTGVYSAETLARMSKAKIGRTPPNYKGSDASYSSLHSWVTRKKGRPQRCEHCFTQNVTFHWANVSGEYLRDLDDFIGLCVPCHSILDKGRNSIKEHYEKV